MSQHDAGCDDPMAEDLSRVNQRGTIRGAGFCPSVAPLSPEPEGYDTRADIRTVSCTALA